MGSCDNNCEAVADLHESSVNLIAYSKQINKWVNGGQNETVVVGGVSTPTLRNLAMSIKQLVGVYTDEITITIDADKKIKAKLKSGGGIKAGSSGLYVDMSELLQLGNGLAVDSSGKLIVDFSDMPTDKFAKMIEDFRKGLNLPKWAPDNFDIYVDKNHANKGDSLVPYDIGETDSKGNPIIIERGHDPSYPFETPQAAINYVAQNYNLAGHRCRIRINEGNYWGSLMLPDYSANGGHVELLPYDQLTRNDVALIYDGETQSQLRITGGNWQMHDLTLKYQCNLAEVNSTRYVAMANCTNGVFTIGGCKLVMERKSAASTESGFLNLSAFSASGSGVINIIPNSTANMELAAPAAGTGLRARAFYITSGGQLAIPNTVEAYSGDFKASGPFWIFADCAGGRINVGSAAPKEITFSNGSPAPTGKRYSATAGGAISVGGRGEDYFPGSSGDAGKGTADKDSYSWYK